MTILIIIAQHGHCGSDHMLKYQLGVKPINSIWINFYHLKKYLLDKSIQFFPVNINHKDFNIKKIPGGITNCISIFNDPNGFRKPTNKVDNLSVIKKIKGVTKCKFTLITELINNDTYPVLISIFDKIFTNRQCAYDKVFPLGFAANKDLLYPLKHKDTIRILVDHPAYTKKQFLKKDKTRFIINSIFNHKFEKSLLVRRFINGDIETICDKDTKVELYNRKGINILNAYDEYNHADIFFVTHPESMGLSVIESAMAGTLIVLPKGYIRSEFLEGLNCLEFDEKIDWDQIFSKLNANQSRRLALKKTWGVFFDNLFEKMKIKI